jgi:hypothetical protein
MQDNRTRRDLRPRVATHSAVIYSSKTEPMFMGELLGSTTSRRRRGHRLPTAQAPARPGRGRARRDPRSAGPRPQRCSPPGFHCPYCHGFEVSGRRLAVLGAGPERVRLALHLSRFTDDVVLCTSGAQNGMEMNGEL